jgi:hypothetical protein
MNGNGVMFKYAMRGFHGDKPTGMDEQVDVSHGLRVLSVYIVFYIVGRVQRKAGGWQVFQFTGVFRCDDVTLVYY